MSERACCWPRVVPPEVRGQQVLVVSAQVAPLADRKDAVVGTPSAQQYGTAVDALTKSVDGWISTQCDHQSHQATDDPDGAEDLRQIEGGVDESHHAARLQTLTSAA